MKGIRGPIFIPKTLKRILIVVEVLMVLAGAILLLFRPVPGLVIMGIGAFVVYLTMNSGYAAVVGGYNAMRRDQDKTALYTHYHGASDRPMNPWDAITAQAKPEEKPAAKKNYGQERHTEGGSASPEDQLSRLEAQYRAGLYSKQEYKQMKQELLRQKK